MSAIEQMQKRDARAENEKLLAEFKAKGGVIRDCNTLTTEQLEDRWILQMPGSLKMKRQRVTKIRERESVAETNLVSLTRGGDSLTNSSGETHERPRRATGENEANPRRDSGAGAQPSPSRESRT